MIRVVAYDIPNGYAKEVVGEFESVQMTGNELRDVDGNVIMSWYNHVWFIAKSGNGWYDWTVEAVNG